AMCRSLSRTSLTRVCPTALCSPVRSYILYDEPRTWFEAQSFCREHHLDLATITNSADATLLSTDVTGTDFAWIGLFDDMTEWRWSDGNVDLSSTNFTNWEPSSPDFHTTYKSDTKVCVGMLTNGLWDDTDCYYANSKVCSATETLLKQFIYAGSGTFSDGQTVCRAEYEDLATIENQTENDMLLAFSGVGAFGWIGLYDNMTYWNWSLGETVFDDTVDFSSWAPSEPDLTAVSRICVSINANGSWSDEMCDETLPAVCY
ncbi:hypothetical protein NQD34_008273, partial [Periophthalmus magnuspinnatus]